MALPARRIHQQISVLGSLYRLADAVNVASVLIPAMRAVGNLQADLLLPGAVAIIVHYVVAELGGMYRSWRGVSSNREAVAVLSTWVVAFAVLAGMGVATERFVGL